LGVDQVGFCGEGGIKTEKLIVIWHCLKNSKGHIGDVLIMTVLPMTINKSAWPAAQYVRQILTDWATEFPMDSDFLARFQSSNYQSHLAAFFELSMFKWFKNQDYSVTLHQTASAQSTRRPDFCISKSDVKMFYAECTLSALPDHDRGVERLKNQILDVIENIPSPKYWVNVDFIKSSTASLAKRKIITFVKNIIEEGPQGGIDLTELYKKQWILSDDGWQIGFSLFPKQSGIVRTLGAIHGGPAGIIYSEKPLRGAMDRKKGSNYGSLDTPYVICINSSDFYLDDLSVMQTLFGSRASGNGFSLAEKESDGFFYRKGQPLNKSVSAVLIAHNLVPWNLHVAQSTLWHNPFASSPLPTKSVDVHQINFSSSNTLLYERVTTEGKLLGEILQVDAAYMARDVE
jgi:hypothetical protein